MSSYLGFVPPDGSGTNLDFVNEPAIVTPLSPEEEKVLAPLYEKKSVLPVALAAGAAFLLLA